MRKILLSLFVIFTFGYYLVVNKTENRATSEAEISTKQTVTTSSTTGTISITPNPNQQVSNVKPTLVARGLYLDGEYLGSSEDAYYGYVQVKVIIKQSKIADVLFLDYPRHSKTSREINSEAVPVLRSEAIRVQSANVNIVSGATETSRAFKKSLSIALYKAKN